MTIENKNIKKTEYIQGPFVIVVTVPDTPDDEAFPVVVAPPAGFSRIEQAEEYIESNFATRKEPYLGCHFEIVPFRSLGSFVKFCSWED